MVKGKGRDRGEECMQPVAEAGHMHSYCLGPETVCTCIETGSCDASSLSPALSISLSLSRSASLSASQKSTPLHPLLAMFLPTALAASGLPSLKVNVQICWAPLLNCLAFLLCSAMLFHTLQRTIYRAHTTSLSPSLSPSTSPTLPPPTLSFRVHCFAVNIAKLAALESML